MKRLNVWAVWLWFLQALTGSVLVLFVVIHIIDNATILISSQAYENALALWHETLPGLLYKLLVIGLVGAFLVHALNGIRIASKPYKDVDASWLHNRSLRHHGTTFWYLQVMTGSTIGMFAIWHLINQHGTVTTTTAAQSAARVTPTVFIMYVLFLAALMFHAFNGVRSILLKLGVMTDRAREAILVSIVAFLFVVFFGFGLASLVKFLPPTE